MPGKKGYFNIIVSYMDVTQELLLLVKDMSCISVLVKNQGSQGHGQGSVLQACVA